jgi:hypothetical protein
VSCDRTNIIVLCVYMAACLVLTMVSLAIPDMEMIMFVVNILITGGWFFCFFGAGSASMLILSLVLLSFVGASELVLRYNTKMEDETRAPTPMATTPRINPDSVQGFDTGIDAEPSAPPADLVKMDSVKVDGMGVARLFPPTHNSLTNVGKKRS